MGFAKCPICEEVRELTGKQKKSRSGRRCQSCFLKAKNKSQTTWKGGKHFSGSYLITWKSQAKCRGIEWAITLDDLDELWVKQSQKCALSRIQMHMVNHGTGEGRNHPHCVSLDRIDSSQGYIKGNIQLVCCCINYMKRSLSQADFITYCKAIVDVAERVA